MKYYNKLIEFLRKDTGGKNESTKLRFVLRIILSLLIGYNFISSLVTTIFANAYGVVPFAISFFAFVVLFAFTYYIENTFTIVGLVNVSILLWMMSFAKNYGWNAGVQSFVVVLLVLNFFTGYKNVPIKFGYAGFLVAFRYLLFVYSIKTPAVYKFNSKTVNITQFFNTLFSFLAISILCYIFSRDSQALERKLIDYNIQLVNQANTDPLTGLNNRRNTMEYLEKLAIVQGSDSLSVAICDIDFFKKVNDSYGHDIGDKVLKSIAQTMVSTIGEISFISRWGGEEFLIVFPHMNGDNAFLYLQILKNEINKLVFDVKGRSFKISMTYGLSEYDFRSDIQSLIKDADKKLYYGKENGRDQVVF